MPVNAGIFYEHEQKTRLFISYIHLLISSNPALPHCSFKNILQQVLMITNKITTIIFKTFNYA
jgi:hypothetical protein